MKPKIDSTSFGSITVDGETFDHDILIRLNGHIKKRKKKLSKEIYGTSHIISLEEAEYIYEEGTEKIIIGTGQTGFVKLSEEAEDFFMRKKCGVELFPTPWAIARWNEIEGKVTAVFHVTC
ncbi:MAG TPA: Mth938-like domain-containing protein [Methanosarcina sp.]|nr:Mth938-like domain-containing protein [Methanosarcina sp.]